MANFITAVVVNIIIYRSNIPMLKGVYDHTLCTPSPLMIPPVFAGQVRAAVMLKCNTSVNGVVSVIDLREENGNLNVHQSIT